MSVQSQQSKRRQRTSRADCPLSDPRIGLITENDHRVRLCLCPMCSCGEHICPAKAQQEPYLKSAYQTTYGSNYQRHLKPDPIKVSYEKPFMPQSALAYVTSSSAAYTPHSFQQPTVNTYKPEPAPKLSFNARSSYASDFPDWGGGAVYYVKQSHIKHTNEGLSVPAKSAYTDNYSAHGNQALLAAKEDYNELASMREAVGFKLGQPLFYRESMTKRDYGDLSKKNMVEKAIKPVDARAKPEVPRSHYVSTAKSDYRANNIDFDHRSKRKQINKEGLY